MASPRKRYRTAAELLVAALDPNVADWVRCPECSCHCPECREVYPHDCELMRAIRPAIERRRRKNG